MNTKHFDANNQEMTDFVDKLVSENKWVIDIRQDDDTGRQTVCWIEHKEYIAPDGLPDYDEVWIDANNTLVCVQDMSYDEVKAALRAMLYQERVAQEAIDMVEGFSDDDLEDLAGDGNSVPPGTTIH